MKNRIDERFLRLRGQGRKAFVPYIMAGYPDTEATFNALKLFNDIGADVVELGVPFTDPVADGPVIQAAADEALKKGVTLKRVLKMVKKARRTIEIPIVLMTYYNPVYKMGLESFFMQAHEAGVDGLIVPDLLPDEADDFIKLARGYNISTIFLLAPTSTEKRAKLVVNKSTGFIYYVSITGITGAALKGLSQIKRAVKKLRSMTDKPVCVGFGVKTPSDARAIAEVSDGVIVGSSIVRTMAENPEKLKEYVISLRKAIDEVV
ncbi:MAG: tryptophan synthase subunit alpha [Nitrospirae bacterium]|nr:MAG: tryptophan synthase subunit alpha [Nitrospirota bacterium]